LNHEERRDLRRQFCQSHRLYAVPKQLLPDKKQLLPDKESSFVVENSTRVTKDELVDMLQILGYHIDIKGSSHKAMPGCLKKLLKYFGCGKQLTKQTLYEIIQNDLELRESIASFSLSASAAMGPHDKRYATTYVLVFRSDLCVSVSAAVVTKSLGFNTSQSDRVLRRGRPVCTSVVGRTADEKGKQSRKRNADEATVDNDSNQR
jgi:hypothetical protein